MEKIHFQVSAKTARLIGRENISEVDGAVNELVKNGYDADADCVLVKLHIPFVEPPKSLSVIDAATWFGDNPLLTQCYDLIEQVYELKIDLDSNIFSELDNFVMSLSKIIVVDNGSGMTKNILENSWMNIGTSDKESNYLSPKKKRVKTGAKGIGRFALDKLSIKSKVITKNEKDVIWQWELDWQQFEKAAMLKDVSANLVQLEDNFKTVVKEILGDDFACVEKYDWSSGTIIILDPLREKWSEKLFIKTNNTFKNINPLNSVDFFEVIVRNDYYPKYNFKSSDLGVEDYDYCIEANFDGAGFISISLDRKELNIKKKSVCINYSQTDQEEYDLTEFWERDIFKVKDYSRKDFNKQITKIYPLKDLISLDLEICRNIGPFSLKLFYLKNAKSTIEITRDYKLKDRKEILNCFSGIVLYRDNFKVRPYGEEGQFYDWLDLSGRVQRSPAAASHQSGFWRVSPNQIIGSVSISRVNNPLLIDSANREGLLLNREYYAFISIIQAMLSKFEYDRQYPLREYANWINSKKNFHNAKVQEIYEQAKQNLFKKESNKKNAENSESDSQKNAAGYQEREYTKKEYEEAILYYATPKEDELTTNQLLMILSSTGVLAQTFAHEISRIATELGSRGQHLTVIVDKLLDYKAYEGDEDYNPYLEINELDSTDVLLADWVNLMMDSLEKDKFKKNNINILDFLEKTKCKWASLLLKKNINIEVSGIDYVTLNISEVDLHLLVNNFIINSAYYLEEVFGEKRIDLKLYTDEENYILELYNNGPKLNNKYKSNPSIIFNPQESSKKDGTGIGLWVAHESVVRNDGTLTFVETEEGFLLRAKWPK